MFSVALGTGGGDICWAAVGFVLRCKGIWGAVTQASSPLGQRPTTCRHQKILTRYHSNFLIRFSCHANVMVVRPPSTILSYVASTETMISVRGRTFLLGSKIDKGKQKRVAEKGEMISRYGNKTIPKWPIAARTEGKVKEIVDDDQRTPKIKVDTYRSNPHFAK